MWKCPTPRLALNVEWSLSLWKSKHRQSGNTLKKKKKKKKSFPYMSHNLIWWDLYSCWSYTKWSLCCRFQSKNAVGSIWQDFHLYSCCSNKNQSYISWSVHCRFCSIHQLIKSLLLIPFQIPINYHSTYTGHWLHSKYKLISILLISFQYLLIAHCSVYLI